MVAKKSHAVSLDGDAFELANMGYKQEFSRSYDFLSTFSFALSISGLMGTISITYLYPLWSGGPAAGVWCWFIGALGCLSIAWSVAEITSCFPTSGGMYYVITHVVPKRYVSLLCWIDGWLYFTGALTGACSTDFGAATLLLQTASMYSDYSYVPTRGHITGVAILVILSHALINSLPGDILARVTKYYCIVNISTTLALIVTLLVKCPKLNTAKFTFTTVINSTGWATDGWAFLFGFLQVSWVMTCYDATSRMSEEIHEAAYKTPLAIATALTTTAVLGWILCIVITLCMGTDVSGILTGVSGQPIVEIFRFAMGKTGATAFLALAFCIIWFCGATAMCYTSRSIWSFARDGGLPFSKFWYQLTDRTGVPTRCVWLIFVINSLLTIINLGSTIAMNAIFSACAICTDWSYIIVIAAFALNARKMGVVRGPFHMGKFSPFVMYFACVWTVFVSIVFIFPNYMPVTKEDMNYTVVILGAVFIFAGGWYAIDARKWYTGPVANVDEEYDTKLRQVVSHGESSAGDINYKKTSPVSVENVSVSSEN
ncbi:DEKNAAC104574 [Brettanomyces naardenensis]|uniref:DEKNAAC104574 n=1 Tax=Brettanomyces naardenensis TaxID=13370 RepID=A0A448YRD4_BRENA|nr:DEKNAAC104574 [Brettanomyces naardenensis]